MQPPIASASARSAAPRGPLGPRTSTIPAATVATPAAARRRDVLAEREHADQQHEHGRGAPRGGVHEPGRRACVRRREQREVEQLQRRGGRDVGPCVRLQPPVGQRHGRQQHDARDDGDRGRGVRRRALRPARGSTPHARTHPTARGSVRSRAPRASTLSCAPMADQSHIRNFSIIAHIDHGKSTLADRILEMTKTVETRDMRAQLLDSMDLERERGITIKAQAVRVLLRGARRRDLPAPPDRHARATSTSPTRSAARSPRARARCWSSTPPRASRRRRVANTYLAIDGGLELIPCLNKIDLPGAEPERVAAEIAELIGEPADDDPADLRQDRRGRHRRARGARRPACRRRRRPRRARRAR